MQRKDLTPVEKMCGDRCLRAFCRVVIECNQCKELKGLTDNEAIQVGYAVRVPSCVCLPHAVRRNIAFICLGR